MDGLASDIGSPHILSQMWVNNASIALLTELKKYSFNSPILV